MNNEQCQEYLLAVVVTDQYDLKHAWYNEYDTMHTINIIDFALQFQHIDLIDIWNIV